ncbi:hypothetical protein QJS04_geneDACA009921 [Acorus gramineus]|uniref:Uncharacterized protein n=1 Tax=Acorus gramineus TaxID=55184 RepID=A0AAV9BEX9_ACOGR|nr:hypothetical protein QJS04_geneDACA009921 [Acorus gramineus]
MRVHPVQRGLRCDGLNSIEAVDPKIIRPLDDRDCIVKDGGAISPGPPFHSITHGRAPRTTRLLIPSQLVIENERPCCEI